MNFIAFLRAQPLARLAGWVLVTAFFCIYSLLMLHKYWQFEYFFVDNVYFHTALWRLASFQEPIVNHQNIGLINIFGDHFHPIILVVSFLLMVFPWNETVFVLMAFLYAAGGLLGFELGLKLTKTHWLIVLLLLSYFSFVGTQNAMLFGFHEIHFIPLLFFIPLWGWQLKKNWLYWLGIALLLAVKETMFVPVVCLAGFLFLVDKSMRKKAVFTAIISVGWYLLVSRFIIPYFSGGFTIYSAQLPNNFSQLYEGLFVPTEKLWTVLVSFASFGLLPLAGVALLPLVLQDFLIRFLFSIPGNMQYTLGFHYSVASVPVLFFSSIWAVKTLEKYSFFKIAAFVSAGIIILTQVYLNIFSTHVSPLLLAFHPAFYQTTQNNEFLRTFIRSNPLDSSVMTMNHMGIWYSHVPYVFPLEDDFNQILNYPPKYLVFDTREGQNPNNYFPATPEAWQSMLDHLTKENFYKECITQGSIKVLCRTERDLPSFKPVL